MPEARLWRAPGRLTPNWRNGGEPNPAKGAEKPGKKRPPRPPESEEEEVWIGAVYGGFTGYGVSHRFPHPLESTF